MASRPVAVLAPAPAPGGALVKLGLSFSPVPSIGPGEAFNFSWSLFLLSEVNASIGSSVTASLIMGGTVIWTSPLVPVFTNVIHGKPPAPDWLQQFTGTQQESVSFPAGSAAAQLLYKIGKQNIELQVLGNGPAPGPFTAQASLVVVPNPFPGTFWSWNPAPTMAAWKTAYSLGGVFSNLSPAPLSVSGTLVENDATDNSINQVQTMNLGSVGSGTNTGSVTFTPITQSWQWFDDITFITDAPQSKTFIYTVTLNAQDPWENQYQATSPAISIVVSVPFAKLVDCGNAFTAAASAAGLTAAAAAVIIFAPEVAAGLFAAAAVAYGTAQAFGNAAKDPPTPDPLYREVVETKAVEIPAQLSGSPTLEALANLFRLLLQIAADHESVSVVDSRVLGALNASDREAVDSQIVRRTELAKHMNDLAMQLPAATGTALQTIETDHGLDPVAIRKTLLQWKQQGIPPQIKDKWSGQGLAQGTLSAIESVIAKAPIEALTIPIEQQMAALSLAMANWNATTRTQAPQLR